MKFVTFAQFDKFLEAETRVNRIELVDSRYISKNNFMNQPCKEFSGWIFDKQLHELTSKWIFRVHACLYFIAPSGHRLKVCEKRAKTRHSFEVRSSHHDVFQALDLEFMRRLCTKVNIIPVIGEDFDRKLNPKSLIGRKTICTNICRKSRHVDKNRAGLF